MENVNVEEVVIDDEVDDDEEEIMEIPVHGVAAIEGRATGDARGFRVGALMPGALPQPLGYEFESAHGGDNSRVAVVGRIDEFFRKNVGDITEFRWRGVIMVNKPYAAQAIESIIDGSYTGMSIVLDSAKVDVEEARERARRDLLIRDDAPEGATGAELTTQDVEEIIDVMVGNGEPETTWFAMGRVRRVDMVPTGAFQEAYAALGHEFWDEMTVEQLEASAAALADCGCADEPDDLTTAAFAPGTKDGRSGILSAWSARLRDALAEPRSAAGAGSTTVAGSGTAMSKQPLARSGQSTSLTIAPTMTSAGTGRDTSTAQGTVASLSPVESSGLLIGSFTNAESDPSLLDSILTTFAEIAGVSTRDILNLSLPEKTSLAAMLITRALDDSAATVFTTSLTQRTGKGPERESGLVALADKLTSAALSNARRRDDGESVGEPQVYSNPTTRDGPGWVTNPTATARIRRYWVRGEGAAKIRWGAPGDFNRCRKQLAKYVQNPEWLAGLCANMHKEALGIWPGEHRGQTSADTVTAAAAPLFSLMASAGAALPSRSLFENPRLSGPSGIVVDGERVYGHIATWNVCHVAEPGGKGVCTLAPHSRSHYAYYLTGTVQTDEGPVAVGSITMNTGHAGQYDSPDATIAHYDNTGLVVADVAVGEDRHGIWFSGRIRPHVTEDDRYALAASGRLSGDWRRIGRDYELVAALVVNSGGFPIAASLAASAGDDGAALIGEGSVPPEVKAEPEPVEADEDQPSPEDLATESESATPEFVLPLEQVRAIGAEVLAQMDQREHLTRVGEVKSEATRVLLAAARASMAEGME